MRIAISTGGGDAPGLNAVIRAAVLSAVSFGWEVIGVKRGFAGLLGEDECVALNAQSVRGIAHLGGTILRTTNRGNPFSWPVKRDDGTFDEIDRSDELLETARAMGIDACTTAPSPAEAIEVAREMAGEDLVCVTGSHYVVGEARGYLLNK